MSASTLKSILVCIEYPGDRRQPALRRAVEIARRTGARLTLFHSTFSQLWVGPGFQSPALREDVEKKLASGTALMNKMAARLRRQGIKVSVKTAWDYPAYEAIVREVLRSKPQLVMAASRRHALGARLFLTNTDWQLIRLCPAPLLFVKNERGYGKPRVLAAIDPIHQRGKSSRLDSRILEAAQGMTQILRGRMDVLHAHVPLYSYMPDYYGEPTMAPVDAEVETQYTRSAQRTLQRVTAPFDVPARNLHVATGMPQLVIPAAARRLRADMLVMGVVSRSALGRMLIGNTAERVLDRLSCDVLVIKPRGFRTSVTRRQPPGELHLPPF